MALDSCWPDLISFIAPIQQHCAASYEKTWSAENRVRYSSLAEQLIDSRGSIDYLITIKPSLVKDLTGKEKTFLYEILRTLSIADSRFKYLLYDFESLLHKRGFYSERYFYLQHLTDDQFCYEIDTKVWIRSREREYYYRRRNSRFGKKQLTLQQIFDEYFFTEPVRLNVTRARRKVRHKGYRDHGSLGSEFSRTQRQQSSDWSIRQKEENRQREIEDRILLYLGIQGWL